MYFLPIHTILLTMSLINTHYCDILLNMSQRNAHFDLISPTQKMPSAFFATDLGNRQQATGTPKQNAPRQGALIEKCGTVRGTIKSPLMKKCFMPMATGNYTHNTLNRVNKPIAYITSLFSISFQSVSFYTHYFGKMPFKAFSYIT